eukprot:scaffold1352_cov261-Pinguiococcus_pyrenoidosus.AAC.12
MTRALLCSCVESTMAPSGCAIRRKACLVLRRDSRRHIPASLKGFSPDRKSPSLTPQRGRRVDHQDRPDGVAQLSASPKQQGFVFPPQQPSALSLAKASGEEAAEDVDRALPLRGLEQPVRSIDATFRSGQHFPCCGAWGQLGRRAEIAGVAVVTL